jgi:cell division protease FtsH
MGIERKSMVISEQEKRLTAYHEAGHALAAALMPESDPVHKVTIIPRGRALGLTQQLPLEDKYTISKTKALNDMVLLYGGRAAEELALLEQTSGAGNDLERATELARKMVCEWGMSEVLGPLTFGQKDEEIFLGRELTMKKDYSDKTAEIIDQEIKRICLESQARAKKLIGDNMDKLELLATALLERESLDAQEISLLLQGKKLPPLTVPAPPRPEPQARREYQKKEKKPAGVVAPRTDPVGGEI